MITLLVIGEQTGSNKRCNQWRDYAYYRLFLIIRLKHKTNPITDATELDNWTFPNRYLHP